MIVKNATSPKGVEPQFWYRTYNCLGWEPVSLDCRQFPPRLGAFVEPTSDKDSGWRTWETPANAEFVVDLAGGKTSVIRHP